MYIVICSDHKAVDIAMFSSLDWSDKVFGPFEKKQDAEEWVDNNCGKAYFSIVKIKDV
jgi:hypothetical protein